MMLYLVHLKKIQCNLNFLICCILVQDVSYTEGEGELQERHVWKLFVLYRLQFSFHQRDISFTTMTQDHPFHQTTKKNT